MTAIREEGNEATESWRKGMTSPAYDIKEERPRYTEIDPIVSVDAWIAAEKIAEKGGALTRRNVVRIALREAARVERWMVAPSGMGFVSAWPEIWRSGSEKFAVMVEQIADKIDPGPSRMSSRPTARDVQRYEEVCKWLKFCHYDEKTLAIEVVWSRARGYHLEDIGKAVGLKPSYVRKLNDDQLAIIANRLIPLMKGWHDIAGIPA